MNVTMSITFPPSSGHDCATSINRRRGGFTLIEVLAVLMLMVVVLPVVMGALSTTTQAGSLARSHDVAVALAEAKLAEIVAERSWSIQASAVPFDSDFGPEAERYSWTLDVRDWNDPQTRQLTLAVHWRQHGRDRVQQLATVVSVEGGVP